MNSEPSGKPAVPRAVWNAVIDALAFAAFVLLVVTGFIMRYTLPPGSGRKVLGHPRSVEVLWGLDRHEWGEIHFWIAVALLLILAVHLFLHWRWIVSLVRGKSETPGWRVGLALAAVVVLLALALSPLFSKTERMPRDAGSQSLHEPSQEGPGRPFRGGQE